MERFLKDGWLPSFLFGGKMKRKYTQVFTFIMASILFISCPLSVYASEKWEGSLGLTLYYNKDKILQYFKDTGKFWLYAASEAGAILKADFVQFAENYNKMDDILSEEDKIGVYVDKDDNAKGVFFSKEFMAEVKALIEQYAKENEPYFIVRIPSYKEVNVERFATKGQYLTICNLAKKYGLIGVNGLYMSDLSEILNGNYSYVNEIGTLTEESLLTDYVVNVYDESWEKYKGSQRYKFDFPAGISVGYEAIEDGEKTTYNSVADYHSDFYPDYLSKHSGVVLDFGTPYYQYEHTRACLISRDGIRTRVFKSMNDFKNYSVGNRKVYYTKDYYDYEPDDLSASVDDLEKSVDELQKIIDELLKKIDDLTSESDIEDLLKQILDALKNQQGTGGGGSGGGGDVTVNVDLTETNSWLSKIYEKISQIYNKMNTAVENAEDAAFAKIQESLDEIIAQLKKIKRWTAIDTVVDGVDAIADWLDLIRGVLKDAKEGAGSAVAALSSAVGDSVDTMSRKFPFSIPWDILFFVSVLSAEPQVPHFEIPFNIELSMLDITIDYTMELDFTQLQWLSDLSRLLLSMTYAVGLMKMTFGVTSAGKEE